MNYFVKEIKEKYKKEDCFINNIKENYKCNIEFKKEEEDEEDLIIGINLYQFGKEELILRFLRKHGNLNEYNEKVLEIISSTKELIKKKKK